MTRCKKNRRTAPCVALAIAATISALGGACNSEIARDAAETPVGTVLNGKTRDPETYLKRVSERNKTIDRDIWRPENGERF